MKIKNENGENIDLVVEGNSTSNITIIFVHGLGTNKDENLNLFIDLAKPFLPRYRVIRFDLSGCGKSEGKQEEASIAKHTKDLKAVLDFAESKYNGTKYILAFSMGCFVVLSLSPEDIEKTVFISPPNPDPQRIIESTKARISSRPDGKVVEDGISIYPRSAGSIQKLGPAFWGALKTFKPVEMLTEYSKKTDLILFRPMQDEVVSGQNISAYRAIKTLEYVELSGTHGFADLKDREKLIVAVQYFVNRQHGSDEPHEAEQIIVVDGNDKIIGYKTRKEVDREGLRYRVSGLWIKNSKGENLLAKRAYTKEHDPGRWGPAVAGTNAKGESYLDTIIREAYEELGLEGVRFRTGPKLERHGKHSYFVQWFFCVVDRPLKEFHIQKEEVAEIKWFSEEELKEKIKKNPDEILFRMENVRELFPS